MGSLREERAFLLGRVAQSVGKYFALIRRNDEAGAEYRQAIRAYEQVPRISPEFAEAQKNMEVVRKLLDELQPGRAIPLSQWLSEKFKKSVEAGWEELEDIFGGGLAPAFRGSPAFMNKTDESVRRARLIHLDAGQAVVLVIEVTSAEDQKIRIRLRIHPGNDQTYLPENLRFTLRSESGELLEEVYFSDPLSDGRKFRRPGVPASRRPALRGTFQTRSQAEKNKDCIVQLLTGSPGEGFSVSIALGDVSVTEDFVI